MVLPDRPAHPDDVPPTAASTGRPVPAPPQLIGPGTHLVREFQHSLGAPLSVPINSMVVLGAEPLLVDTGTAHNADAWRETVFSLVDPGDVRWIFISHDDSDHTGNLAAAMELCPRATLLCSWSLVERMAHRYDFPLRRLRWLADADRIELPDRTLSIVRPPVYDSPTTQGLYDSRTGIYWAADAFATPLPGGAAADAVVDEIAELSARQWWEGMVLFGVHALAPWVALADPVRYARTVRAVRALDPTVIASGHSPAVTGRHVPVALDMIGRLAQAPVPPCPDQSLLDDVLRAMGHEPDDPAVFARGG
ncbi:MBL fold metallo-hydrolase (plasmid) [Streptomyces sp. BI20]|uniref:MBL fold metallo-hydrolase n=1 Tax=Streptomyces sp. BI20 TaxID=3403460 RepID=UPI003C75D20E